MPGGKKDNQKSGHLSKSGEGFQVPNQRTTTKKMNPETGHTKPSGTTSTASSSTKTNECQATATETVTKTSHTKPSGTTSTASSSTKTNECQATATETVTTPLQTSSLPSQSIKDDDALSKKSPVVGYFHSVSPLKESRNRFKYFNFSFQTRHNFHEGVCFEPTLLRQILSKEEVQKCVKMSNYGLKTSIQDSDALTIVINRNTRIEMHENCKFEHKSPENTIVNISEIQDIPDYSIITIMGKVHVLSNTKRIKLNDRRYLSKMECNIADSTAAIRLTVWEEQISNIENDLFYQITNARVRTYLGEKYLSVNMDTKVTKLKSGEQNFNVVSQLYTNVQTDEDKCVTVKKIDGIQQFHRYNKCKNAHCNKRLNELQSTVHYCEFCGLRQIMTPSDQKFLSLTIIISEHDISLRLNDEIVDAALELYNKQHCGNTTVHSKTSTESEIVEALLLLTDIKVTYNTTSKIVLSLLSET